jgi:hypothetical protein
MGRDNGKQQKTCHYEAGSAGRVHEKEHTRRQRKTPFGGKKGKKRQLTLQNAMLVVAIIM